MPCPMCQSPVETHPPQEGYQRCPSCGGLSLVPYPVRQTNTEFEGPAAVARHGRLEELRQSYFLRYLKLVEQALGRTKDSGRLFEIGCGAGVLLRTAASRGWQADGLEYSPELAAIARGNNPAATIEVGDVLEYEAGASNYDAVIALDVIEHVLDPGRMLRTCASLLGPEGLLLLQTPNVRGLRSRWQGEAWDMRDPLQHLNLFTPGGLDELLTRNGFSVETIRTVGGTGLEKGWRRGLVSIRQWLLDRGSLGNALLVTARRNALR